MGVPPVDAGLLAKAHEMVGSGFALQVSTTILMATLASVAFGRDEEVPRAPRPKVPEGYEVGGLTT